MNSIVFNQVMVLFLIMVIGYICRKTGILNSETVKKLSELLLKVTMPFTIIIAFQFDFSLEMLLNAGVVLITAAIIHIFSIIAAGIFYRKSPEQERNVMKFITVFSNCGFMGFPVIGGMFGQTGIFFTSIYVAVFQVFLWTYGVMLYNKKRSLKEIILSLFSPGLISVVMGILLFVFSVRLPAFLYHAIDMVGSMTSPLSMIIIGSILAETAFKNIFSGFNVYKGALWRLVAMPLIVFSVLYAFGLDAKLTAICTLLAGMPPAANTVLFARMYNGEHMLASRIVGVSTIFSVITIPLIIFFLSI